MVKQSDEGGDNINITAGKITATKGGTVGVDRSTGKTVSGADKENIATPVGFLLFAIKQLPLLIWAVGVVAILAMVAIASHWRIPPAALVFGGIGIFVGMFGLVIFAALVQPMPKGVNPPLVSKVTVWAFAVILIGSGFLSASSFFFDWPVPLRSQFFPKSASHTS